MSKDGRSGNRGWSLGVQRKLAELAELVAAERFGAAGVPKELTFSEIEEIGHQVGRLAAGTVDRTLQERHAEHVEAAEPCPQCGASCVVEATSRRRSLQTRDGTVELAEPVARCRACQRDFFPSASAAQA